MMRMNYKSKAFRNNIYARILAPIGYTIILLYTYKANMLEGKTVAAHFPHYKFSWWYLIPCVVLIHFFFLLKRWYLYICVIYKYNKDSTSIYRHKHNIIYISSVADSPVWHTIFILLCMLLQLHFNFPHYQLGNLCRRRVSSM